MGIYQLIFPIYAMCFSLTSAGIQTSISRFVAAKIATGDRRAAKDILGIGLFISVGLSAIVSFVLYLNADFIAIHILDEKRCCDLLRILAFTIPFGAIHSCINGYYYGLKKAHLPATSQLVEQLVRVGSSYLIFLVLQEKNLPVTPALAVIGIILGEFAAMLFCVTSIIGSFLKASIPPKRTTSLKIHARNILSLSIPLTANRVLLNILQSVEAIMIPGKLRNFGMSVSESLSVYGVLNGMALPLILFPSAITNSVSVMLLPTIAEAQASGNNNLISRTIQNTIKYCLILGIFCTGAFLMFGPDIGNRVFGNELAGTFIIILCWICPFLYLSTTLNSVINGLGKTSSSFFHNTIGLGIRILFVFWGIPRYGIIGYLWGLLVSELVITFLSIFILHQYIKLSFSVYDCIVKPVFALLLSAGGTFFVQSLLLRLRGTGGILEILILLCVLCVIYIILLFIFGSLSTNFVRRKT